MPNGGWQTPYGTVGQGGQGDAATRRIRWFEHLLYSPESLAERARNPAWWDQLSRIVQMGVLKPEYRGEVEKGGGVVTPSATERTSFKPEYLEQVYGSPQSAWDTGRPLGTATTPGAAPVGPWSPGMMTPTAAPGVPTDVLPAWFTGAGAPPVTPPLAGTPGTIGPQQTGAPGTYPVGIGMRPPALGVAPGLTPAFTPGGGMAPGAGAPTGGGGAPAGTPATTGAFGPFGSIEDWRNQFYQEHGRWPTDTDAQDAIASFGFLSQTGRPPSQKEWEDRWYGGYGGTTQWGPMGGQYGYGGGGGWAPPPEPSWWGGNVFGEEGWAYLPSGAGQYPYPTPERGEQTTAPWYNIQDIQTFQQVDPQYRDWLQQAMQSQQQYWENPLMAPIQWMQPAQTEL